MRPSVESIYNAALEKPPGNREGYLDGVCGSDVALRSKIDALLKAHVEAGSFMVEPARNDADLETVDSAKAWCHTSVAEQAGQQIGHFKLLQSIGEGGFGTVWMAEQREPVKRRVAVKIIKLGMDTQQVIARFEAERQALAMMDHPNIAKVLDAGSTDTGRPYFAMEYIKGVPILDYCDTERLDTRARLELFTAVCHAIQHAHQKGIIHRDIKPSNVLVTLHDGVPVPKVIDFGIAKATNSELTQKTLFTEHRQMIGTPAYMSPEQAEMSGLDIDTRSDVYSLGVLLYELLTGTTPFDTKSLMEAGFEEMMRIIRDEEPHKPSTRLSTLGEKATRTAEHRRSDLGKLSALVRGDLDWIVMKCLEKDRTRRYETANGLAADLRRHLAHEPVLAGPPSAGYKLSKFVRRNRGAVVAGSLIAASLIFGLAAAGIGFVQASRQREVAQAQEAEARAEAARANTIIDLIDTMLGSAVSHSKNGPDYTVRQLLGDFDRDLTHHLAGEPLVEATIRTTMGRAYLGIGLTDMAGPHLSTALDIRRRELTEDHDLVAESQLAWASLLHDRGEYGEAERILREVLATQQGVYGDRHIIAAPTITSLADVFRHQRRNDDAEALLLNVLEIQEDVLGPENPDTLRSMNILALVYREQGKLAEAEPYQREALEGRRRVLGDDHPSTLDSINNMGVLLRGQGELAKAELFLREALEGKRRNLGDEHPRTLASMRNLAEVYERQARYDEAEPLRRELLEHYAVAASKPGADVITMNGAAWALLTIRQAELRDPERALALALQANEMTSHESPMYLDTLALAYHRTGDTSAAIEAQKKALSLLPADAPRRDQFEAALARFEAALKDGSE
jgi:serine/threonine protein kinase/tetratricopeptide (TPR) repeat protein